MNNNKGKKNGNKVLIAVLAIVGVLMVLTLIVGTIAFKFIQSKSESFLLEVAETTDMLSEFEGQLEESQELADELSSELYGNYSEDLGLSESDQDPYTEIIKKYAAEFEAAGDDQDAILEVYERCEAELESLAESDPNRVVGGTEIEYTEEYKINTDEPITTTCHVGETVDYEDLSITYLASGYVTEPEYETDESSPEAEHRVFYIDLLVERNESDSRLLYSYFSPYSNRDDSLIEDVDIDLYDNLDGYLSKGRYTTGRIKVTTTEPVDYFELGYDYEDENEQLVMVNFAFEGEKNSEIVLPKAIASANTLGEGDMCRNSEGIEITLLDSYVDEDYDISGDDGYKCVTAEFKVENLTTESQYWGDNDVKVYADGCSLNVDLSSTFVSAKGNIIGYVHCEVPVDAQNIEIEYTIDKEEFAIYHLDIE